MPINFQSEKHATVLMLDESAETLLGMMGLPFSPPGALRPEDIAPALEKLQLELNSSSTYVPDRNIVGATDDDNSVSIRHRALPLIDLLEHAAKAGEIVYWSEG